MKKGYTADLSADLLLRSDLSGRRAARRHAAGDAEAVASARGRAQTAPVRVSVSDRDSECAVILPCFVGIHWSADEARKRLVYEG